MKAIQNKNGGHIIFFSYKKPIFPFPLIYSKVSTKNRLRRKIQIYYLHQTWVQQATNINLKKKKKNYSDSFPVSPASGFAGN